MQPIDFNTFLSKKNIHRPLIFNSGLWSLSFIILLFVFSKGENPIKIDYIYTFAFLVFMAIPVSLNFYLWMPRLLKTERYWSYSLVFLGTLLVFTWLFKYAFNGIMTYFFNGYFFISYFTGSNCFIIFFIFLLATTLLKLAEDWFYFNASENRRLQLKNSQIETQLSSLRAQMNPHFLFNSLNVIYAMALQKKQEITKAIVDLSDILRYVIYDSDTEQVSLKQEVELINSYIAFQNYRIPNEAIVNLHLDIEDENFKLYPMLLLPIIENSFKYGIADNDNQQPIVIYLTQKNTVFTISVSNGNYAYDNTLDSEYSGVGLKTLRRNLQLVYPNSHQFTIESQKDTFKVTLTIDHAHHSKK